MALDPVGNWYCDTIAPTPMPPQQLSFPAPVLASAGPPSLVPPACPATVVDSNGRVWNYYNGAWH
jgi:hypothetical protein